MEQHPVPQNVTTFQFRLIGDMTIKQFGYLAIFAVIGYIIYKLPFPTFLTLPLGVGAFLFGFGLAFVPIEERPMDAWVLAFIKSIYSPTQYIWHREKPAEPENTGIPQSPQAAAAGASPNPIPTPIHTAPQAARPVPAVMAHTPSIPPPVAAAAPTPTAQSVKPKPPGFFDALSHMFSGKPKQVAVPAAPPHPPTPPVSPAPIATITNVPHGKPAKTGGFLAWLTRLFSPPAKPKKPVQAPQPPLPQPTVPAYAPPPPVKQGPDVFADAPTPPIVKAHLDIPDKTQGVPTEEIEKKIQEAELAAEARAQEKNKELEQKLLSMQEELKTRTVSQERILELQKQLTDVLSEKNRMEAELRSLRSRLSESRAPAPATKQAGVATPEPSRGATVKVITAETAVRAGLPKLTTFPNVVTGIIKDFSGNLLPGVLVTVRDREGTPLRALKTNKLGQFAASTPLPNNTYVIEVEDPRNRYVFDKIQITLTGNVVPAVEVIAKSERELSRRKLEEEIFGGQNF